MIICDVDNCIADDSWRLEHIDWDNPDLLERFHEYHSLSIHDQPHNIEKLRLDEQIPLIILTAMPVMYRPLRIRWLYDLLGGKNIPMVLFRPPFDFRPSAEVKCDMVKILAGYMGINLPELIDVAYDDNPAVVAMYKEQGINADRLFIHENYPAKWHHNATN